MKRFTILAAVAAVAFAASGFSAEAGCYQPTLPKASASVFPTMPLPFSESTDAAAGTIVGLWHTKHFVQGKLFFESLEQWHTDGTELEFANIPTITGNLCLGAWVDKNGVAELYHIGWTFDAKGNPSGTLVLTASDTVTNKGNGFTGPFVVKFFDTKGKLLQEMKGTTTAVRIPAP